MNLIYHKTSSIGEIPLSRTIYKAIQGKDCFLKSLRASPVRHYKKQCSEANR